MFYTQTETRIMTTVLDFNFNALLCNEVFLNRHTQQYKYKTGVENIYNSNTLVHLAQNNLRCLFDFPWNSLFTKHDILPLSFA